MLECFLISVGVILLWVKKCSVKPRGIKNIRKKTKNPFEILFERILI